MRIVLGILLFCAFWLTSSFHPPVPDATDGPIRTIIIDAGHGGKDPGAVGRTFQEKNIALGIAIHLRDLIHTYLPHMRVVLTRANDNFIELHERGRIAQAYKGDFFVSIHCNASTNRAAFGSSTYVLGINRGQERYRSYIRENQTVMMEDNYRSMYDGFDPKSPESYIMFSLMKNVFRQESLHLADKIQGQLEQAVQRKNRGVKQGPFIVLWSSAMPAVLCETGFITNSEEEKFLATETGQVFIASGILRGIKAYNYEFR